MQQWITIMTFTYPHECYIIQGALEAEGIETFLRDELSVLVDNALSPALGGVKLQVKTEQLNEALELLQANGYLPGTNATSETTQETANIDAHAHTKNQCPFCGLKILASKKFPLFGDLSLCCSIFPFLFSKRTDIATIASARGNTANNSERISNLC